MTTKRHCPSCHHPDHGMLLMSDGYWTCDGCGHHEQPRRRPRIRDTEWATQARQRMLDEASAQNAN